MNLSRFFLLILFTTLSVGSPTPSVKIQGSTTVNPVVVEAAEAFREKGWRVTIDTQGGSSGGISALGEGQVNIAMVSRPINEADRIRFPKIDFQSVIIGYDGVALVVSKKVYDGGVHALSKNQLRDIYESKIKNWKAVGGSDSPIVFFNKEPGRGTWEVFANYLYGNHEKAPSVHHPEVGGNEEGRTKVSLHSSAITQLSASWAEGSTQIQSLALKAENGKKVFPSKANVYDGSYPMRRALAVVTNGKATGATGEFINYLLSEKGQKLVEKHGYLTLKALP